MNHTENYQLNQWAKSDRVLMEDFNSDNQKIDAALGALPKLFTGSYIGDGTATRVIHLGFQPKAVLVMKSGIDLGSSGGGSTAQKYGGLALGNRKAGDSSGYSVEITASGFRVFEDPTNKHVHTNMHNVEYVYLAFQ